MSSSPSSRSGGRRLLRGCAAGLGLSLVAGVTTFVGTAPAQAAPVDITLVDINDFHGRIDADTTKFATTVEQIRAAKGEDNTLLVSAGDNIGASLFASSNGEDEPTIEVLNALGMASTTVGNHEFDRGFDWLRNNVINGQNGYTKADFPQLGANVIDTSTGEPALDASSVHSVGGLDVCMIGAVTQETPSLVSPGGIEGLEFADPVDAVNTESQRLENAGTCDVTVASYHDGAPEGTPDGATLEEEIAESENFRHLVQDTDAAVDVIFTGHTHKQYAWDAPKPGGGTRPIVQTGSYGENVGQVDLTVDNGEVTAYTAKNVARAAAADLSFERVAEVKRITDAAIAAADKVGNVKVGSISDDVTTAFAGGSYTADGYTGGTRDQRELESTLGNMVAGAVKNTPVDAPNLPEPDLGVVNPGGLRSDLFYPGDTSTSPENTDGAVTFEEANAVLPFVNNISYVTMTGADLRELFEQQWQPTGSSRSFLHLGVSGNVHTTLDASKAAGKRVTSLRIDGKDVDPDAKYTVATFSFLAQGGDNFTAFTKGKAVDTGKIDRELWIDGFWKGGGEKSPSFARQQLFTDAPRFVRGGQELDFTIDKVNLTSIGTPANTEVTATLQRPRKQAEQLGTFPVTDDTAKIDLTLPNNVPPGSKVVFGTDRTDTTLQIAAGPSVRVRNVTGRPTVVRSNGTELAVTLFGAGSQSGEVEVRQGRKVLATGTVDAGTATVTVPRFRFPGAKDLTIAQVGTNRSTGYTVNVRKARPAVRVTHRPDRVVRKRTNVALRVAVRAPRQRPVWGRVRVRVAGETHRGRLENGVLRVRIGKFARIGKRRAVVSYLGNRLNRPQREVIRIRVVRR